MTKLLKCSHRLGCKDCAREKLELYNKQFRKDYYQKHKERLKETTAKHYRENIEERKAYGKQYYQKNKESISAKRMAKYYKNKEK